MQNSICLYKHGHEPGAELGGGPQGIGVGGVWSERRLCL